MPAADLVRWTPLLLALFIGTEARERLPDWMYHMMFAASEKPVLRHAILSDQRAFQGLKTMVQYYQGMTYVMTRELKENDESEPFEVVNAPDCMRMKGWPEMRSVRRLFRPPEPKEHSAHSDIFRHKKTVFKALGDIRAALDSEVAEKDVKQLFALRKGFVPAWASVRHADQRRSFSLSNFYRCMVRSNVAILLNGTWGVLVRVVNDRPTMFPDYRKQSSLAEYLTLEKSGRVGFLPYFFDLEYKPKLTRRYWGDRPNGPASSVYAEYQRHIDPYNIFYPKEDNLAIREAVSSIKDTKQNMVKETVRPSNSAILLLPVLLAVIPSALFAETSSWFAVCYVAITDFLALIPLLIKGIEILQAQNTEIFKTRTIVYGDLSMRNTTVVASTWSCSCSLAKNLTTLGYSLVFTAIFSMLVGTALEVIVRTRVESNKRRALEAKALWTSGEEYLWERTPPCDKCDCFKLNASSSSSSSSSGGLIELRRKQGRESGRSWAQSALGVGLWDSRS